MEPRILELNGDKMNNKRKQVFLVFLAASVFTSCSVKKDDSLVGVEGDGTVIATPDLKPRPVLDQDKDGLSDDLEATLGRDKLTGNFPSFSVGSFNFTEIEIKDFLRSDNDYSVKFYLDDKTGRDLSYNPIRDKMAKASYQRVVGQPLNPDQINYFDFGVVKLSNFSHVDYTNLKNYLFKNKEELESKAIRLQSRLFIDVDDILGIQKIYNIKCEVGFVSGDGSFNSLGGVQDLIGVDRTRVTFNSRGDSNTARSNTEVMVYIDRLSIDTLNLILDNDYDLALKIVDYKAELSNGRTFSYSTQLSEASTAGSLFAISTPEKNALFFNTRKEPIDDTIKRYFRGDTSDDNEGTLLGIGPMVNTSSFPIIFEEGGNEHLDQNSWFLFSANNKTSDTPDLGESVMLGFFQNSFIAQSSKRLIQIREKSYEGKTVTRDIVGLSLGETVAIEVKGVNRNAVAEDPKRIHVWVEGTQHRQVCVRDNCGGGPVGRFSMGDGSNGGGPRFSSLKEDDKCGVTCHYPHSRLGCEILWRDLGTQEIPLNLYSNNRLSEIKFTTAKNSIPIPLTDSVFFKRNPPVEELEKGKGSWLFKFKIDDEFLLHHGESIKIHFPVIENPKVVYGFNQDISCAAQVRNHTYQDPNIKVHHSDGDTQRTMNFKITRSF